MLHALFMHSFHLDQMQLRNVHCIENYWSLDISQVCRYMGERELKEISFLKLENRMLREE
jgi:hypothetical protein